MNKFLVAVLLVTLGTASASRIRSGSTKVNARGDDDLITNLPGQPAVSFKQYAGYVQLPGQQKNSFYWFVESTNNPKTDPVVRIFICMCIRYLMTRTSCGYFRRFCGRTAAPGAAA